MLENEKKELKLFVVGESSANPETWDGSMPWAIVIAHNADEATSLARDASGPAVEIVLDKPRIIYCSNGDGGWAD